MLEISTRNATNIYEQSVNKINHIWKLETGSQKMETRNQKMDTRIQKLETGKRKMESGSWKMESGSWKMVSGERYPAMEVPVSGAMRPKTGGTFGPIYL